MEKCLAILNTEQFRKRNDPTKVKERKYKEFKQRSRITFQQKTLRPQDIEILDWCLAESVLPHGEKMPL